MAVLTEPRDRYPVLDGWLMQAQGLLDPRRVLLAPEDDALHLVLWSSDGWALSNVALPPDLCSSGQPLNSDVLGETIADLLLEQALMQGNHVDPVTGRFVSALAVCVEGDWAG